MKKLSIIFLSIITLNLTSCKENAANRVSDDSAHKAQERDQNANAGLPEMTFSSKEFDFGTIDQGVKVNAIFEFENTGKTDLIITKAKASCGCTVPEWPKNKAIKPGEKSVIKATFDSSKKKNKQNKSITLTTNTATGKEILYVKGFVTPDPSLEKKNKK